MYVSGHSSENKKIRPLLMTEIEISDRPFERMVSVFNVNSHSL